MAEQASSPDQQAAISYQAELKRKAIHLIALIVPLGMALLGKDTSLLLLAPLAFFALAADILRVRSARFAAFIQRFFGSMMRHEELPPVGGPLRVNGATWVLLSATMLTVLFPIHIAVPVFVMFMVSDAAAALVGRRYGKRHWRGGGRTIEGTLAFVLVGMGAMALFPGLVFWISAVSVVAAALAEAFPGPFNDNMLVPLVAATVVFVLERFVLGLDVALLFG